MTPPPPPPPGAADPSALAPEPTPSDRELVASVASGERAALRLLYERHAGWLTVRLQRRCGEAELVDSAVQDTFLAVWKGAGTYRGDGDVGAWLWGIAARRLIDLQRKRRPAAVTRSDAAEAGPSAESAEAQALEAELGPRLSQAIAALEPELREALLATAVDGLTTRDAGRRLGIPQGTVKTRLLRARRQLQEALR